MGLEKLATVQRGIKENVIDYGINFTVKNLSNLVKNRYGYEVNVSGIDTRETFDIREINNWIKAHDSKYDERKKNKITGFLSDTEYIFNVDENTFIYVRAGKSSVFQPINVLIDVEPKKDSELYLYIFGKKAKMYYNIIMNECGRRTNSKTLDLYNISGNKEGKSEQFNSIVSDLHTRDLNTLFYQDHVKEDIITHIDTFLASENIYKERDLLYKTGILLYGEPGTGKTSLATAIATKYESSLIIVDMTTFDSLNVTMLTQCINADNERYVILLEDIDTMFNLDRDGNNDKDDKKVINKLLQFLDSNNSPNNVIFIATTNHVEVLDEAILRNGRFDLKVPIEGIYKEEVVKMCKSFNLSKNDIDDIMDEITFPVNQSKLQSMILSCFKNKEKLSDDEEFYDDFEDENDEELSDNKAITVTGEKFKEFFDESKSSKSINIKPVTMEYLTSDDVSKIIEEFSKKTTKTIIDNLNKINESLKVESDLETEEEKVSEEKQPSLKDIDECCITNTEESITEKLPESEEDENKDRCKSSDIEESVIEVEETYIDTSKSSEESCCVATEEYDTYKVTERKRKRKLNRENKNTISNENEGE